jgi:hypothetical protein
MASIYSPYSRTVHRRGEPSRTAADHLVCLLVFSIGGLLTDCLALAIPDGASLAPLRFALIAGAAPVAAMVALRICR